MGIKIDNGAETISTEGAASDIDLNLTPKGNGNVVIDGQAFPNGIGSNGDHLEVVAGVPAWTVPSSVPNNAVTNVAQEYTRTQNFNATTLTDAASISWDLSQNQVASVTLAGNRTLANPTNLVDGATYILTVKQDATGTRTLAYGTAYKFPGGTAPTLTTTASAVDILTFVCDGTNMYGVSQLDFK